MSSAGMTPEQIKAAIRHEYEEYNKRNLSTLDETYSPNVVVHNLASGTDNKGLEKVKQAQYELLARFPDMHRTIEDITVEGDKAAYRFTSTGTHKGRLGPEAGNLAPTGRKVTTTTFVIRRYEDGKMVEAWNISNRLSFYQQLGVTPTPDMK